MLDKSAGSTRFEASALSALAAIARAGLSGKRLCLFMTPGAVVHPKPGPQRNFLLTVSKLFPALRFGQVGASYPQLDPATTRLLRAISRKTNYLSVRDAATRDLLAVAGVTVPIVPDLAFKLPRRAGDSGNVLALSFRTSPTETIDILAARLRPIVTAARAQGLEPRLFWQVLQDRETSSALSAALDVPIDDMSDRRPDIETAGAFYKRAAIVCSNRLHALLIGAAYGALPMAVLRADEQKVTGSFDCGGLANFISKSAAEDAALLEELLKDERASGLVQQAFEASAARIEAYFGALAQQK
ncbi:polysaccharide pyruvyl transferase [Hephaestia caeni]|uniref:Polysaccharide pyruvyl transferase n=2 Tax=Hephaestia caeni TaxID=645617 RepID=A0A397ND05_9SPHN|nr:polysaccharide pyruvyl transferase [Hephaestia caeni]